ncbi:MAG: 3-hydroxyacyl-CoA dehydrogenase NAD-binding domain-containing protein [Opitutaceae bacterium]
MNIVRTSTPDGLCILTFDRPGSSANVFDRETLDELETHLTALENDAGVRGVILTSAKPKVFIAGADLNAFAKDASARALHDMVDHGHRIFTQLSRLKVPGVAAIRGVCLGGGLEVALACDWRVASIDKATKLGLPETQLGILPAWGGSTRLPHLIGLPAALSLILTGKQIAGAQALKLGVVDEATHPEYLLDAARTLIARGKRPASARRWSNTFPFTWIVAAKARFDVRRKTRGHYPAPLKAIDVCTKAASSSFEEGLMLEKESFLELVRTPECRNLLSVYFLQERAKKLTSDATTQAATPKDPDDTLAPRKIRRVAVIGAGTMGAGIAQWISARGTPVRLKDVNPEALARGMHAIEKVYAEAVKRRVFTPQEAMAGIDRVTPLHTHVPMHDVDLVIEAALEKLDVKQQVFREVDGRVAPHAVLATNTSALSIDAIASAVSRPERVVGMHFFNPVHRMQLVEIVRGKRTSSATVDTALQFTKAIGKLPVIVKDSPGFLVNRILLPYMVEAIWLFTEGTPAAAIDRLMMDFGMPMGPLRLIDEVGLDVAQHVAKDLERRLRSPIPINDTLEQMMAKGWLGRKSGRGFYIHNGRKERPAPASEIGFLQTLKPRASDDATRRDRLVLIMINEAARVMAEGVVDAPEDVDFGMIMGTGWAPFRGGPLRYADSLGTAEVLRRLESLARDIAPHFEPCDCLRDMVDQGLKFYSPKRPPPSASLMDAKPSAAAPAPAPTQPAVSKIAATSKPPLAVPGANAVSSGPSDSRVNSDDPSAVPEAV